MRLIQDQTEAVRSALTLDNFRKWLESHPTRENVGFVQGCSNCPIAMFLLETTDIPAVMSFKHIIHNGYRKIVYFSNFHDHRDQGIPAVPEWVVKFIEAVDNLDALDFISAAIALNILDDIEKALAQAPVPAH